jgi:DnaJ-class molecular chaperone
MNHAELVTTAQNSKAAWEVERIVVGCSLPEQILRVQKSDCTDPVLLKAAWKKVAFQVHPDRCSADGASVAMAIAKDAFDILAWRAEQYQAAAAFALAQNDGSKAHTTTTHLGAASTGTAAGAGGGGDTSHNNNNNNNLAKPPPRPLSAPAEIVAGGVGSSGSGPQPPMKVRVKLKVKK